jgi:hypothetical protein
MNLPRSLAKGARNIIDVGSNLLHLEGHDQVSGKVNASLGMVADRGSSGEGENIRDGSTDELEGVVLVTSCKYKKVIFYFCLAVIFAKDYHISVLAQCDLY